MKEIISIAGLAFLATFELAFLISASKIEKNGIISSILVIHLITLVIFYLYKKNEETIYENLKLKNIIEFLLGGSIISSFGLTAVWQNCGLLSNWISLTFIYLSNVIIIIFLFIFQLFLKINSFNN